MAGSNTLLIWVGAGVVLYLILANTASAATTDGTVSAVSESQLQQTETFESFSPTAYKDGSDSSGNQLYSIGYGHQIQPGESYLLTATISQDQAETLLAADMQNVENVLNNSGSTFTQGQFDAASDFGYNEGVGALDNLISTFQNQGAGAVPPFMLQYIYWHPTPGGAAVVNQSLVNRRNANVATWNS